MKEGCITSLQEFADSFGRNREKYIRIAMRYIHVRDVAEEVVHEGMAKFLEKRYELDEGSNYEAYFCTLLCHQCLNWLRDRAGRLLKENDLREEGYRLLQYDIAALESSDPNRIYDREILDIMRRELERLPQITRNIFLDSRFANYSYDGLAKKYRVSKKKVAKDILLVLRLLRVSLRDYLPAPISSFSLL